MSFFSESPLPNRPIKIIGGTNSREWGAMPAAIFLLALGLGFLIWQLPGILRDLSISQDPVVIYNSDVRNGDCDGKMGLTFCQADISYSHQGRSYESSVSMSFFDLSSTDYNVDVVISEKDPSLASVSLGIEKLSNRIIFLAIIMLFFWGLSVGAMIQHRRSGRIDKLLAQPGRLDLVPVGITEMEQVGKFTKVKYEYEREASKRPGKMQTKFKKQDALILEDDNGNVFGLAAKHEASDVPVLLDTGLERLELTPEERQSALNAIGVV